MHTTHTGRGSVLLQRRERLQHARSVRASVGVFEAMGKKSEAKQMFTEAAGIRRQVLGADHPLTKKSERLAAQ